jgi:hypothetical protein
MWEATRLDDRILGLWCVSYCPKVSKARVIASRTIVTTHGRGKCVSNRLGVTLGRTW